jgi:hypothetical protein
VTENSGVGVQNGKGASISAPGWAAIGLVAIRKEPQNLAGQLVTSGAMLSASPSPWLNP